MTEITRIDREREREDLLSYLSTVTLRQAFIGARRICKSSYKRSPNWVLAMEMFLVGSTYANALCRQMEIDPDAYDCKEAK